MVVMAMMALPTNQLSTQTPEQVIWHPESSSTSLTVINGDLAMPGCEEEGYGAIGFTPEVSTGVPNPNYDPNDPSESTYVNSYLIVVTSLELSAEPLLTFFDLVATSIFADEITDEFKTEFLGSKSFKLSDDPNKRDHYHSFFFEVEKPLPCQITQLII